MSRGRRSRQIGLLAFACLVGIASAAGLARAQAAARMEASGITSPAIGYDISYPQCNGPFPTNAAFAIVGVNGGRPYSANPCLGNGDGPSELAWAGIEAGLYANTADPGPVLSSHWPNGQSSPKECNTATHPGADSAECAYDYGWNAAADSYQDAVNAFSSLGWAPPAATRTPVANQWWLDVETANSWRSDSSLNIGELEGEVDYLRSVGAASVGFYSSAVDWATITGGATSFAAYPSWVAGAGSLSEAQANCMRPGFTGGRVALAQYPSGGFDADFRCSSQAALAFGSAPQALTAGRPSAPVTIELSQAASAPIDVTLSSSSAVGRFAASADGPWSLALTLTLPAGASVSDSFVYEDTKAGSPTLTASATGYSSTSQPATVSAAALATISISPRSARLPIQETRSFRASGADAYRNPVRVTPRWSVSAALGRVAPNPGNPVSFRAVRVGRGTVRANVGSISGTASVAVTAQKRRRRKGWGQSRAATLGGVHRGRPSRRASRRPGSRPPE